MQVPIRRFNKELPLPTYQTPGSVAQDCLVREGVVIPARSIARVPLNIALKPPSGYFILLAARSSLHKRGLMFANSVGIFDEDYCGDEDEYTAILFNFTEEPVEIARGDRVAQMVLVPHERIEWSEVQTLDAPNRGGIGSTGVH